MTCLKEIAKKYIVDSFDASGQSSVSSAVLFYLYAPGSGQGKNRVVARLGRKRRYIPADVGYTTCCDIVSTFASKSRCPKYQAGLLNCIVFVVRLFVLGSTKSVACSRIIAGRDML